MVLAKELAWQSAEGTARELWQHHCWGQFVSTNDIGMHDVTHDLTHDVTHDVTHDDQSYRDDLHDPKR